MDEVNTEQGEFGFRLDGTGSDDGGEKIPALTQDGVKGPPFSAPDSCGLGKELIYFSPFMSRTSDAETSCRMRSNLIWLYNYCMTRPWQYHGGQARQGSAGLCPALFILSVGIPWAFGGFIYSRKPSTAYKLWFLN